MFSPNLVLYLLIAFPAVKGNIYCLGGKNAPFKSGDVIFNMETLFNVSVLNTIWKMISGVRFSPEDQKMKTLQKILADLFKTVHMIGAPFSYFPILKYIAPQLSGYQCYKDAHIPIWDFLRKELEYHKKTHNSVEPRDLMDVYLNVLKSPDHGDSFSEEQLMAICLDMFMAGSETTNNTIIFCFMYLILNPQVQKKAQEEIDNIIGDRFPCLGDKINLPYIEAIVLEALRMFAGRAFALPHRALKNTNLGGHFIPKNSLVIANLHGSMMGPDSGFENPEEFRPERYLKNGKISVSENYMPFGLGKRRCIGDALAKGNIFLFTTALLQKYDFQIVPDSPPDMKVVDGVTPAPLHYKARIRHRKL